jgi:hypothetical protein
MLDIPQPIIRLPNDISDQIERAIEFKKTRRYDLLIFVLQKLITSLGRGSELTIPLTRELVTAESLSLMPLVRPVKWKEWKASLLATHATDPLESQLLNILTLLHAARRAVLFDLEHTTNPSLDLCSDSQHICNEILGHAQNLLRNKEAMAHEAIYVHLKTAYRQLHRIRRDANIDACQYRSLPPINSK